MAQPTMQDREKIVLDTLEKVPKDNVVLIGGYAVNAYVPPRFSIDCDLVVLGGVERVEKALKEDGFSKTESGDVPYGNYARYEKNGASFDLLVNSVLDRETGIAFDAEMFEEHSKKRNAVGRATPVRIEMIIADPELLFAMKFVTGRRQDVRDLFMLSAENLDWKLVTGIIEEKCGRPLIKKRTDMIKRSIRLKTYRDSPRAPTADCPTRGSRRAGGGWRGSWGSSRSPKDEIGSQRKEPKSSISMAKPNTTRPSMEPVEPVLETRNVVSSPLGLFQVQFPYGATGA